MKAPLFIGAGRKFRVMCGADLSDIDMEMAGEMEGDKRKRTDQDKGRDKSKEKGRTN
jgi:hypothetical protein